ncbi:MAG: hypothetical protein SCK29_02015 [Bacillota bacterium]|nr:hypothetical protein [Bacillota bacterium]MDW7682878.1 hypothetical protein [Bacillota bacterium]
MVNKTSLVKECRLSIMETALVWELLLTGYKAAATLQTAVKCVKNADLKDTLESELRQLNAQTDDLELTIRQVGLPVPLARPLHTEKILFIDDTMITGELLRTIHRRIGALGYVIRSAMTNRPLRLLAAAFLVDEMSQLQKICYSCKRPDKMFQPV